MVECTPIKGLVTILLAHDPPFVIGLPYDCPYPSSSRQFAYKTLVVRQWPNKHSYSPLSEVAAEVAVFPLVNEVVVCHGWGWLKLCVPVFTIVLLVGGAVMAVVVVVVGEALGGATEVDIEEER